MAFSPTALLRWSPVEAGGPAPDLSLTADDGTWIKLPDFRTHLHVVLVFFRDGTEAETGAYLKALDAAVPRFKELEAAVFGVNTKRTDKLRDIRAAHGIDFFLLYDPLAIASRGFRTSGRIRPEVKDAVVIVGKDGNVLFSAKGRPTPEELLGAIARVEGKEVPAGTPPKAEAPKAAPAKKTPAPKKPEGMLVSDVPAAAVLDIDSQKALELLGQPGYVLVDVRTRAEFERDHSPLAKHIPVDEVPHRYFELKQTENIIFVCQGGGRSASAAEFMTSIGSSRIYNVLGGMSEWTGPKVSGPVAKG